LAQTIPRGRPQLHQIEIRAAIVAPEIRPESAAGGAEMGNPKSLSPLGIAA
jgi:hypothetical protein